MPAGLYIWTSHLEHLPKCFDLYIVFSDANTIITYEDDHQFQAVGGTLADVHDDLAVCAESASSWYKANLLKENLDKYQTMAAW